MGRLTGVATTQLPGSGSASMLLPVEAQVGDLLVATYLCGFSTTTATGWTEVYNTRAGFAANSVLMWKIATASDLTAGTTPAQSYATSLNAVVASFAKGSFDPARPIAGINVVVSTTAGTTTVTTGSIAAVAGADLMSFAASVFGSSTPPTAISGANGRQLVQASRAGTATSMWVQTPEIDVSLNQIWTFAPGVPAAHTIIYATTQLAGAVTVPSMSATTALMAAPYGTAALLPAPGARLLNAIPTLKVLASGATTPFAVQFQVNTKADFTGTMVQDSTVTGAVKGPVTAAVTGTIPPSVPIYWRSRARNAAGTVIGPWSAVQNFTYAFAASSACEELTINVGAQLDTTQVAGEYLYYSSVSNNVSQPRIWFVYKTSGFAGDHILVYGQGLGTIQARYNAKAYVDYGPNFATPDAAATIADWNFQVSGAHAFDSLRRIFPGNIAAPPQVGVEVEILEIVIPSSITPPLTSSSVANQVYLVTSTGTTERRTFLTYSAAPAPTTTSRTTNVTVGRLAQRPSFDTYQVIPAEHLTLSVDPYMIIDGRPERAPMMGSFGSSVARTGQPVTTTNLQAASAIATAPFRRFLVDPTKIVARPDLGTGVSLWSPSSGAADQALLMTAPNAGYVDAGYTIPSRNGVVNRPAFVLPGGAYLTTQSPVGVNAGCTFFIVAVVHAPSSARSVLAATSPAISQLPAGTTFYELSLVSDVLTSWAGSPLASTQLTTMSGRAVIMGVSLAPTTALLTVSQKSRISVSKAHPPISPIGTTKLHIGRPNTILSTDETARMDILEILMMPTALAADAMARWVGLLDSVYGSASL